MNVKNEICKSFNKHAGRYEKAAIIQHEIGERLFERLDYLNIKPEYVLDLGCGPGMFSKRLKKYYPAANIVGFDLAHDMLRQAKRKQGWRSKWSLVGGDMAAMPFASEQFDLVFANQVIHWSDSLPLVVRELARVMSPQGCLMFSTLGPDTFLELRQAWATVDQYAHTNDFIDMHDLGDCLLAEHFLDPVVDMEMLTAHYPSLNDLLRSLKTQGVPNINAGRQRGMTGKHAWQAFETAISAFYTDDGKCPLTYEVVYGHAWKGEQLRTETGVETRISVDQLRKTYQNRHSTSS